MATDPKRVRGTVINVHALGATVRLEDGRLVAAPIADVNANRAAYTRALEARTTTLPFDLLGRSLVLAKTRADEPIVPTAPAPVLNDPDFEAQINDYLKSTEQWAPPDRPQPFERHLFRKKQRAKMFRGDTPLAWRTCPLNDGWKSRTCQSPGQLRAYSGNVFLASYRGAARR